MKRYFIRCMGAILSAMSFGTQADAGSVDSHDYSITVAPNYTQRWYVGWVSNNGGESHSESFKNGKHIFNQPLLSSDDVSAAYNGFSVDSQGKIVVSQPLVTHSGEDIGGASTGMVIVSAGSYNLLNPSGDGMIYTGARVGGYAGTGLGGQYILVDYTSVGNIGNRFYVATDYYFRNAGCCFLNVCEYSGQTNCSGFSYSGNNEPYTQCECYYTYADVSYTGETSCGAAKSASAGPHGWTGLTTTTDGNMDMDCPQRIQDVTLCYKHARCTNKKYTNRNPGQGVSGCDMISNPVVGMIDAYHFNNGSDWDLGRISCASTGEGSRSTMSWYCTPAFISGANGVDMDYMTIHAAGETSNWCSACPVPNETTVAGYGLISTDYYSNGGYGIDQCYITGAVASDNGGTFVFTDSAGATQTCYGDHYAS